MKRFLKIFFIAIAGVFLLLLILPFFFVGKIEQKMKDEINKTVNATVAWDKVSLSLIRNFPDITVGISNLSVIGKEQFSTDTLIAITDFSATIDLMSAFGDQTEIKKLDINQLLFNGLVAADSTVNWDIAKPSEEVAAPTDTTAKPFIANLQKINITDSRIIYTDRTMALMTSLTGINASMTGDLKEMITDLKIKGGVDNFTLKMGESTYLKNVPMGVDAHAILDLAKFIFTFKESDVTLNKLSLGVDGWFSMPEVGFDMDLKMFARETEFKTLLGLLPAEMLKNIESVKTSGTLKLEAALKGLYVDTDHLPAFNLVLAVNNGSIKYPDLPESIQDIQISTTVNNPGGSLDGTVTNIDKFSFKVANNPFGASLNIITPISNATFKGAMQGILDLGSLKKALPLDSMEMKGIVNADIALAGNYSMIENEQYEQIKADGKMTLKGFEFTSKDLPMPYFIDDATLNFSPRYLELVAFKSRLGKSDFELQGKLENYLAYALKDGVLKGNLNHYSKVIDTNELMALSSDTAAAKADTTNTKPVVVPKNIDFVLTSKIDKLTYDKLTINNSSGKIIVKDGRVVMDGLNMNLLGGNMLMTGQYNTQNPEKPFIDFGFDASKISISQAASSFSTIEKLLPIAKLAQGLVNSKFSYTSEIGNNMMPVLSTINGLGNLKSESIEVSGSKVQSGLVSMLKDEKYKKITVSDLLVNFKLQNGNLIVSPFDAKMLGKTVNIQGHQNLDKTMEYRMAMPMTRSEISNMGTQLGLSLSPKGDDLPVEIVIGGTILKPTFAINADKAKDQIKQELKQELQKEGEKAVEKLMEDPKVKKGVEDVKNKFKNLLK